MESFWRAAGIALGKHWKWVAASAVVISVILLIGTSRLEFATGQDSYLNPDSQVAIDNVAFQDDFGGETVVLLYMADDDTTITDLFEGDNLAELQRVTNELGEIPEVYAVVTPDVSLQFSDNLLAEGVGTSALISAAQRDEAGAEARNADVSIALARLGAVEIQEIGQPDYNELLIFGNDGFEIVDGELVAPSDEDREIRLSLLSTFPDQQTAVGGVVLQGNASLEEQTAGTEAVLEVLDGANFDGFELIVTGSPVYLAEINDYLRGGMLTLGAWALVVMAVILAVMFRVRWRLLPLLSVIIGVFWAFSLLGLIGIDLSLVTISGLPILIGLGIDFAIQVHNRVEEEVVIDREEHPIAESLANMAPPLIAAAITGVVAVLALRISRVPMIRDFGVLLAIGIVVLVVVGIVLTASVLGIREWTQRTEQRGPSVVERIVVWLGSAPSALGLPMVIIAVALFVGGVIAEDSVEIQSDPLEWIDQNSQVVQDVRTLEERTDFSTTLGVLVEANNTYDEDVVDLIWGFNEDALARDEVVSTSSLVNTMGKIIEIPGATLIPPTSEDIVAAAEQMPPDIERALVNNVDEATATQLNLRLAPASLEERAVLVDELQADLDARIAELDLDPDSILLVELPDGQSPVRATPAGLAAVGIGLLDNLSANRANLTYLALSLAALWLVLRFRSLSRALLALVPVVLAVGVSAIVVGISNVQLSPLTTVSGPLVIATCAEFSVLILGRYLEERQRGLDPDDATRMAAQRTGRAFFTSAMTTIGGFAVLIFSALPLLSDFGIIVTLNVAIALLAALVVMPPLSVWVDRRGWLGTADQMATSDDDKKRSVCLAAAVPGGQTVGMAVGVVGFAAAGAVTYATADTDDGDAEEPSFTATALPTTTTSTTTTTTTIPPTTVPGEEPTETTEPSGPLIDPSDFGTERPTGLIGGVLFDELALQGVEPNVANCALDSVEGGVENVDAAAVLGGDDAAAAPVVQAALDCGIEQSVIDATLVSLRGG